MRQLAGQPDAPQVQAFIEVPQESDCLPLICGLNTKVHWMPRASLSQPHGAGMIMAARELASLPPTPAQMRNVIDLQALDLDSQRPWELASAKQSEFYAWVAGESSAVMAIRKFLINDLGLDRKGLTLMGYWKLGRSLE